MSSTSFSPAAFLLKCQGGVACRAAEAVGRAVPDAEGVMALTPFEAKIASGSDGVLPEKKSAAERLRSEG